jgi:hypothetical protein
MMRLGRPPTGGIKKGVMTVAVDQPLIQQMKDLAAAEECSISSHVNRAVKEYLTRRADQMADRVVIRQPIQPAEVFETAEAAD